MLVEEAAAELGVSKWAILKAIEKGQIKDTFRIGRAMHGIPVEAWEKYKSERRPRGRPRGAPKPRPDAAR